ncbi:Prosaposin, partial [Fragariocoptes setiger]
AQGEPGEHNFCQGCRSIVSFVSRLNHTRAQFNNALMKHCDSLPMSTDYHGQCSYFVAKFFDILNRIDPIMHCDEIGACGQPEQSTAVGLPEDNVMCRICVDSINSLKDALSQRESIDLFREAIRSICSSLRVMNEDRECNDLLNKYLKQLLNFVRRLDPRDYCSSIQLCSRNPPKAIAAPNLVELMGIGRVQEVKIGEKPKGPDCTLCKRVVSQLEKILKNNATEQEIEQALDRVCAFIHKDQSKIDECNEMVNKYTDDLIHILTDESDPELVCMLLNVCKFERRGDLANFGDLVSELNQAFNTTGSVCEECEKFVHFIESHLTDVKSIDELETILKTKICNRLPSQDLQRTCNSFVDQYLPSFYDAIVHALDPTNVCMNIKACDPQEPHSMVAVESKKYCDTCMQTVSIIDEYLATNSIQKDIVHLAEAVCNQMPEDNRHECKQIVETFGPEIIKKITMMISPKQVCTEIKLCHAPGHIKKLGLAKCSFGLGYWCQTQDHALARGNDDTSDGPIGERDRIGLDAEEDRREILILISLKSEGLDLAVQDSCHELKIHVGVDDRCYDCKSNPLANMIFKIHYGLWYAGLVGIMPFMFNYAAEYPSASATQHGTLYTVLHFIAFIAKPLMCSVADKYAMHRRALIFFILTTLIGYGSLAIYPFFPSLVVNHKDLLWGLYCLAAFIGNTSMCIVNSLGDSLAINSCRNKSISYGEYRLWGPIGFGLFGFVWGFANEIPSLPKYTPGIITLVLIHLLNVVFIIFWHDKEEFVIKKQESDCNTENYGSTSAQPEESSVELNINNNAAAQGDETVQYAPEKQQSSPVNINRFTLMCQVCKKYPSIIGYLILFTICGILTAIHWLFFFRYLEQTAKDKNQSFSLIATLALPVQSLGGELIFFFFSGKILAKLGSSLTLTICFLSFAGRYLAYAYLIPVINLYWILLVELLQGPAFGLMYCVLTHQAQLYSTYIDETVSDKVLTAANTRNSLHSTLQGVLGAAFEGLGLCMGSIIGGRAYDVEPKLMWTIAGFSALIVAFSSMVVRGAIACERRNRPSTSSG